MTISGRVSEGMLAAYDKAMVKAHAVCPDGNEYWHAGGCVTLAMEILL
ncbi:hypothetical protein QE109_17310 [Fusibacter bizertensis]|uniref:Uncharacterized protein n=1 Tax=Fusibacter bizertensis TaxID=1488331 RepID=A0ABT6NHJ2_9FIRM|nr:hypothetical protein [Fusibacter bizertensis]MDH8679909.1 hypothetical protein [Fusibacter bizertensis]